MDICATEVFDIYTNFMKYEAKRHKNRVFRNRHGICVIVLQLRLLGLRL